MNAPTNNTPPAAATASPTAPTNPLEAFAAALEEAGVGLENENQVPESSADAPPAKPKVLKELAALAKLSDDELYGVQVPSSVEGAEPYTIGKLKDLAKEHDEFSIRQLEQEQRFRERDAVLLRTEQELRDLFAALPADALKPELRKSLQEKRDRAAQEERQRVLEVIPEWQNREIRTQELGAMIEHLRSHGFPESYLQGVMDHRTMRYIRTNMIREQRIAAALEKVKARKPSTPAKGAKPADSAKPAKSKGAKTYEQRQHDNFANILFMNTQR